MRDDDYDPEPTVPFVRGSDTSEAAAHELSEEVVKRQRAQILKRLEELGDYGSTDKETEIALSMSHESASARRKGLVDDGLVRDSGLRRKNPASGRSAIVWVLGEGVPVVGAPNKRAPQRPSNDGLLRSRQEILGAVSNPSDELQMLLAWIQYLADASDP